MAATFAAVQAFTGTDKLNLSVTVPADSSKVQDGVPAAPVTLTWKKMGDAADEAGQSREFGGIHFHDGDFDGRALGAEVGQAVFAKAQTYFNGTAS